MSPSWFKAWATESGILVARRRNQPGVNWPSVERAVSNSRILITYKGREDPDRCLPGVGLMTAIMRKFDWSSNDLAEAVGVTPGNLVKWRSDGVPDRHLPRLEQLSRLSCGEVPAPRWLRNRGGRGKGRGLS